MPSLNTRLSSAGKNSREEWIDYLRGTGIILMLIGHAEIWTPLNRWIYSFHMPLFFILSGYLFNKEKWLQIGYKKFAAARFKNFIIPYFIWCAICFIINLPSLYITYRDDDFLVALMQNIGWIITSVRKDGLFLPQNCTPLWFLTCIFLSQMVFFWLVKCHCVLQCMISALFIAINYGMSLKKMPVLPWHLEISLIGSVFMLAGHSIRKWNLLDKIKTILVPVLMIGISTVIMLRTGKKNMYYRHYGHNILLFLICSIVMTYSLMWICKHLKTLCCKTIVCKLGVYSIIAMGLNYSINLYVRYAYQAIAALTGSDMTWAEYLLPPINIVICLGAIILFNKLVAKDRRFNILIGK